MKFIVVFPSNRRTLTSEATRVVVLVTSDWCLSPRAAKINGKVNMAKLMGKDEQLENEFTMLPKDVDYLPTNYGPR